MTSAIRIILVDDHPVVRQGIQNMLAFRPGIEIVAEAGSAAELFALLPENSADLVLLDVRLPDMDGTEVARRLKRERPDLRIIILTTHDDEEYVVRALEAGVEGYLLKSASPALLTSAIQKVVGGERLLSPDLMNTVLHRFQELAQHKGSGGSYSEEQRQILKLIAEGATNQEIALAIFVSPATAKRKVQEILELLGASNRAQAAAEAVRQGLV